MNPIPPESPFALDNDAGYKQWREQKIARHPESIEEIIVPINDPFNLSADESSALLDRIDRCNMAIYSIRQTAGDPADKTILYRIGRHFGLQHLDSNLYADEDAISSLEITQNEGQKAYIPYTNKPIAWHTDGYYNTGSQQIRAMLLHCVRPARQGGSNQLLDHEMAYLLLRDLDPDYIAALSLENAMSIPANESDGQEIRAAVSGPVFSLDPDGNLHMRYTARTRSIEWLDDPRVLEARDALQEILNNPSPYHFQGTLQAGQGLLCNNVLHTRSRFEENSNRLLYRGRYFDRIATT
jgi:alpha-ketoglutarate-dependent taurine dioxygenase